MENRITVRNDSDTQEFLKIRRSISGLSGFKGSPRHTFVRLSTRGVAKRDRSRYIGRISGTVAASRRT